MKYVGYVIEFIVYIKNLLLNLNKNIYSNFFLYIQLTFSNYSLVMTIGQEAHYRTKSIAPSPIASFSLCARSTAVMTRDS